MSQEPWVDIESIRVNDCAGCGLPAPTGNDGAYADSVAKPANGGVGSDAIRSVLSKHRDRGQNWSSKFIAERRKEGFERRASVRDCANAAVAARHQRGVRRLYGLIERYIGHHPNGHPTRYLGVR